MSGETSGGSAETDTDGGNSMWRLYAEYGRDNASKGVVGVLGTVLARSLGLIPAFVLGLAIDAIFLDQRPFSLPLVPSEWIPTGADGQLVFAIGLIVGATVLGAAVTWAQNWGWNAFAQHVQHALRVDTYEAMQGLDMGFFDERQTGELLSVLNNDVNRLESFLNDGISSALRIGSMIVGIGAIMLVINPQLAAVALLPVPVLALFTYVFVKRIRPKYAAMRESVGTLNARLENNVGGMQVIKTETAEDYEAERVEGASQGYFDANWDAITTRIRFFPGLRVISGVGFALTFAVGVFGCFRDRRSASRGRSRRDRSSRS